MIAIRKQFWISQPENLCKESWGNRRMLLRWWCRSVHRGVTISFAKSRIRWPLSRFALNCLEMESAVFGCRPSRLNPAIRNDGSSSVFTVIDCVNIETRQGIGHRSVKAERKATAERLTSDRCHWLAKAISQHSQSVRVKVWGENVPDFSHLETHSRICVNSFKFVGTSIITLLKLIISVLSRVVR